MKIMLITNLFPPHARGGAERVVEVSADAFVALGHEIVVVTTQREGEGIEVGKYKIYRYRPWNLFWYGDIEGQSLWKRALWRLVDLFSYASAKHVASIVFKEHPQVVITHNLIGMGYRIPEMLKRFRMRHVHTLHDVQLVVPSGQWLHDRALTMLHRLYAWLCRSRFGSPALLVSPSQWLLNFHTQFGFFQHSQKIVLKNPSGSSLTIVNNLPREFSGTLRLLFVGQLEEHKGILFLIQAIKKLETGNWKLEIVGDGSLRERVRAMVHGDPRFVIHGRVVHEKLAAFYANADMVVVPSLVHENQPTVILEAFSHGVPVIASSVGGVPELIDDEKTGFLFGAGDIDSLYAVLTRIMQEPKTLSDMRKAIVERSKELTPTAYVTRILDSLGDIRK